MSKDISNRNTKPSATALSPEPTHAEIALTAHSLWEAAGKPSGREQEFWLQAEAQQSTRNAMLCVPNQLPALPRTIPAAVFKGRRFYCLYLTNNFLAKFRLGRVVLHLECIVRRPARSRHFILGIFRELHWQPAKTDGCRPACPAIPAR